jgi:hypothetical protein
MGDSIQNILDGPDKPGQDNKEQIEDIMCGDMKAMTMPKRGKAKAIKAVAAIVPVVAVAAKMKRVKPVKPEDDAFHKVPGKAGHYRYR